MFKFVIRLLGLLFLALAVIAALLDLTRSIADSAVVITPLGVDWFRASPSTLNLVQALVQRYVHPWVWDPAIQWVLRSPTWAVFAVLALIFGFFGRNRRHKWPMIINHIQIRISLVFQTVDLINDGPPTLQTTIWIVF